MQQQAAADHNQFTYSVTEISGALKRVVEDNFGQVRVRGEISGWKQATSGHGYLKLKDENAVLDAVCWKGVLGKMNFRPEDGLEVTCSGRLTTYPGRSNYQLVIDYMEPAGVGALMALLEKRKKQLAAEGLFDPARKKKLPFLPRVIGVVTSPTGAVIRDILHRLRDRFPCHVIVWPVLVQGEGSAQQIARAIEGFNTLSSYEDGGRPAPATAPPRFAGSSLRSSAPTDSAGLPDVASDDMFARARLANPARAAGSSLRSSTHTDSSPLPTPDLIIVARGGGSLEDLWAFNEEVVVRAAAASRIPLISAVGHETDTTLIDYASDRRAPTPTAAAEMAVPVRDELLAFVLDQARRVMVGITRLLQAHLDAVTGLARGLPQPAQLLETATQRLDDRAERLAAALPTLLARKEQQLAVLNATLQPRSLAQAVARHGQDVASLHERAGRMALRACEDRARRLETAGKLLESLSPVKVLERGFALVRDAEGRVVKRAAELQAGGAVTMLFADGERAASVS